MHKLDALLLGLDTAVILVALSRPDLVAPAFAGTLHLILAAALVAHWFQESRSKLEIVPAVAVPDLREPLTGHAEPSSPPSNGIQLLLVEDDYDLLTLLERILVGSGYLVKEAPSADHAILKAKGLKTLDLMVCDFSLPDLDGLSLAMELRRQRPELPILFISGAPDRLEALERSGMTKIRTLRKPFLPDELLAEIEILLEPRERAARG